MDKYNFNATTISGDTGSNNDVFCSAVDNYGEVIHVDNITQQLIVEQSLRFRKSLKRSHLRSLEDATGM